MPPNNRPPASGPTIAVLALAALLAGAALGGAQAAEPAAELAALREQAIAAAASTQDQERKLASLAREIDLLRRELDGRRRGLDETRAEQAELLGALARLSRNPPDAVVVGPSAPLDRIRGEMLMAATVRELRTEAQALAEEIERVDALGARIAGNEAERQRQQEALGKERKALAEMAAQRMALNRKLGLDLAEGEKRIAKLGQDAADFGELIKRAEAEADRRDKDLLARASEMLAKTKGAAPALELADPSRLTQLRAFDAADSALHKPVTASAGVGSEPESPPGNSGQGLRLGAVPGAVVVAPADAQVIYAGVFHGFGPSLILRHGGGYHSVLAALGRLEVSLGQWVLAGEPVGFMPDAASDSPGGKLYIELRRDGRPVDPRPRLAHVDGSAGRGERFGEQKVRE